MGIRILPPELTEKIAAGEVVERPASVLKELVENALDAGATEVFASVGADAADYLEVVDNGTGMRADEMPVAIQRHATSKIGSYEDLFRIASLGFRGEALPSIAAVADLEIESRTDQDRFGTRLRVRGGAHTDLQEVGMSRGTRVVVRNLFHNTPARRKFLRSKQTEFGHVVDTFLRLALSRVEVSFQLKRSGRIVINAPAAQGLRQRVAQLFGWHLGEGLEPVEGRRGEYGVDGLVGPSNLHRISSRAMFFFVNRRPVRDVHLQRTVRAAYRGFLPKGRFPVAILFLTLPLDQVDVNVHPTKMEVHFSRPDRVRELLFESLSEATGRMRMREAGLEATVPQGSVPSDRGDGADRFRAREAEPRGESCPARPVPVSSEPSAGAEAVEGYGSPAELFSRFRIIGQFRETYLVCEYRDRLVLVDQHAAHERIAFERLQETHGTGGVLRQALLVPEVVELPPREADCLRRHLGSLQDCGLEVEDYGGRSFAVKALPALIAGADARRLLHDVSEELVELERTDQIGLLHRNVLARIACHSVVRGGRSMDPAEIEALLKSLDSKPALLSCPHGRPVMISWTVKEIEKSFQRS